jgi:hypothetical protein
VIVGTIGLDLDLKAKMIKAKQTTRTKERIKRKVTMTRRGICGEN